MGSYSSKKHAETTYYKITNENEIHNGYQYEDGLNILDKPFEKEGSCVLGGLYFSDLRNIHEYAHYGCWLREVTIPDDAQFVRDPDVNSVKFRADRIILGARSYLYSMETLELIGKYANTAFFNTLFVDACLKGYIQLAKYCVKNGVDDFNDGFMVSCSNGHLELVQYCLVQGVDFVNDGLNAACSSGHLKVAMLCVKHGADDFNEGLMMSCSNGHLELAKYCILAGAQFFSYGLYASCTNGHLTLAELCVRHGANNFADGLYAASTGGHDELAKYCKKLMSSETV